MELQPRRYLAGLSFGPSSSVLTHVLDDAAARHAAKKSSSPFEPLVVHIDADTTYPRGSEESPARKLLDQYREQYPNIDFEYVHLSQVLEVKSIDWSTLPLGESDDPSERVKKLFDALPTVTARADILRLFIRHLLLHVAIHKGYSALLMGHTTTALAALTLSEVANGRGFSIPWQINDGKYTVCTYEQEGTGTQRVEDSRIDFPVYYPLREVFRNEVLTYISTRPSLSGLIPSDDSRTNSVVSHKDLSIDEVMSRYFEGVEDSYSGIVSNVVRTTGKLDRTTGDGFCGSCGMILDEQGDSRWAGELGDESELGSTVEGQGHLCYGCKRSIYG